MALGRDDSLLFSLKHLEQMERERVERARAAARARLDAEETVRREEARRAAEARRYEERLEFERREREKERERLEASRMDAMREALVARAREEVQARSALEATEATRAHERELERIRRMHTNRVLATWLLGLGVAVAVAGAAAAVLYVRLREARELAEERANTMELARDAREKSSELIQAAERRAERLETEVEALKLKLAPASSSGAAGSSAAAGSKPSPSKGERRLAAPSEASGGPGGTEGPLRGGRLRPETRAETRPARCVDDGDPLNDCLPRR